MKNIKFITVAILLLAVFNLNSCSSELEPVDPAALNPVETDCSKPTGFHVSNFVNGTEINLSWTAASEQTSWEVEYGPAGFTLGSGASVIADDNAYTVTGLDPAVTYEFYVRSNCGDEELSSWVGPVAVNSESADCSQPTALTAVRNATTTSQITVSWTAGGTETAWKIQYGATGFALGAGTTITSSATTKVVTGLLATQGYDFYVMAACSATDGSDWTGPVNVAAGNTTTTGPGTNGFMSAKVNGTQFDMMKPFFYPINGGSYAFINALMYGSDALQIQGNSQPLNSDISGSTEINLVIPRNLWHTGTFTLDSNTDFSSPDPITTCLANIIVPGNGFAGSETGTITVTIFDVPTRHVKGTFSFSYTHEDADGNLIGTEQVTNGTFDFTVDPTDNIN
jgi:hypothetical protein